MACKSIFCFLLVFATFFLDAQSKLEGVVYDQEGNFVENAEVKINEFFTQTDSLGYFVFYDLQNGIYNLIVSKEDLKTEKEITLVEDLFLEIFLENKIETIAKEEEKNPTVLNIFLPTKSRENLKDVEGTAIYAGKKTEVVLVENTMGNKSTGNTREVYSQVVGLNIYENNRSGLQLNVGGRGLDPSRTANFNTRQNGYDISADVLGYPESYYTPPVQALEEIQFVRGAASLQYGTQFGGLINFKLKEPSKKVLEWESRQTVGSYNLFTSFNRLSGTKGKASYQLYYNLKTGENFRPNSEFESHNLFGQFSYSLAKNTQLTVETTYMNYLEQQPGGLTDEQFELDPSFSNRTRNWFAVDWLLYALRLDHAFDDKNKLSLQLFGLDASRKAVGFRGLIGSTNITTDVDLPGTYSRDLIVGEYLNWGAEARYLKSFDFKGEESFLLVGGKYYQSNNQSRQGEGSNNSDADFSFLENSTYPNQSNYNNPNLNFAAFSEWIVPIGKKLKITPGLRFESINTGSDGSYYNSMTFVEDNRDFSRNFLLKGVGISFKPIRNAEFYGNFSENYRSITFSDIRIVNGRGSVDNNLQDESGNSFDVGARGTLKKVLQYDLSTYLASYQNRIGEYLEGGNFKTANIGDALVQGFEGFLSLDLLKTIQFQNKDWKAKSFVNLAYTRSNYQNTRLGVNNVEGNRVELVPRWNIKSGLQLGYKKVKSALQFTYISEQFTDATNAIDPEPDGILGLIPAYTVMDWSWSWDIKKFRLEGGINNLLDNSYFTQRAAGYPGPGIIPSDLRMFYFTFGWQF